MTIEKVKTDTLSADDSVKDSEKRTTRGTTPETTTKTTPGTTLLLYDSFTISSYRPNDAIDDAKKVICQKSDIPRYFFQKK